MGVLDNNKDFLKQNVSQINGKVQNVYFCLNFLPMALFLGNVFEAWEIPNTYLLKIQVLISSLSLVNFLVYKFLDLPDFTKYLGIFSCTTIVSIIAANGRVGIYISYGFFPFLASLYYSKKCTRIVSLYSWIAMMVSMYIKTRFIKQCEPFTAEIYTPDVFFIRYTIGFSMELFFVHLLAMVIQRWAAKILTASSSISTLQM